MRQIAVILMLYAVLICPGCGESEQPPTAPGAPATEPVSPADRNDAVRQSTHELDWLDHYYLNPEPDRIPSLLSQSKAREFGNNAGAAAAMVGFLSNVFAANRDKLAAWFPPQARVFDDE